MAYTGAYVEIPLGVDGLVGIKNFSQLSPGQLTEASSVSYNSGLLRKEPGEVAYSASPLLGTSIFGGWDWWPVETAQRSIIVGQLSTGDFFMSRDQGPGTYEVLLHATVAGSPFSFVPVFVEGGKEVAANNKKLFIFTGDVVQVLSGDGILTTNLATPPSDWSGANQPIAGALHENCLWGWGNPNDPHRVYKSIPTNHEDFTTGGQYSIAVFPGEGSRIVAGRSYRIGTTSVLVLWKEPRGVYYIDTSSADSANWRPVRITNAVGMSSPNAHVQVDGDVLYMDTNGQFQLLSNTADGADLQSRNLSTSVEFNEITNTRFDTTRFVYTQAAYYPRRREAHFASSLIGAGTNNCRIILDFNKPNTVRFGLSARDVCQSLWLRKESVGGVQTLMHGDDVGVVWKMDQDTRSKGSLGYPAVFITAPTDLSYAEASLKGKVKNGQFLAIIGEPSQGTLQVEVVWDGRRPGQIYTFDLATDVALPGGGDNPTIIRKKHRIAGGGTYLSLICTMSGAAGDDMKISNMFIYFQPGNSLI